VKLRIFKPVYFFRLDVRDIMAGLPLTALQYANDASGSPRSPGLYRQLQGTVGLSITFLSQMWHSAAAPQTVVRGKRWGQAILPAAGLFEPASVKLRIRPEEPAEKPARSHDWLPPPVQGNFSAPRKETKIY